VAAKRVNNRTSKEDVRQVSSQRFWPELTLVYKLHLFCDVAHPQTYTTLLGVQCTVRRGEHICLLFWRSWVRLTPESQLCCHIYQVYSVFLSNFGIFHVKVGAYFHRHIYIRKTFFRLMLCTGIYCNWILPLNTRILVDHKRDVSPAIPKHVLCFFFQELTRQAMHV